MVEDICNQSPVSAMRNRADKTLNSGSLSYQGTHFTWETNYLSQINERGPFRVQKRAKAHTLAGLSLCPYITAPCAMIDRMNAPSNRRHAKAATHKGKRPC